MLHSLISLLYFIYILFTSVFVLKNPQNNNNKPYQSSSQKTDLIFSTVLEKQITLESDIIL